MWGKGEEEEVVEVVVFVRCLFEPLDGVDDGEEGVLAEESMAMGSEESKVDLAPL